MDCVGWKEIYGQDRAIAFLKESIRRVEIPHALMFTGPKGVGKFSASLLFTAALFCPGGEPDGCGSCRKVARGVHPDLHVVEAEGNVIRREQITELEKELNRKPAEASRKAAVIDEAHLMNSEAANAFLKTLEEPPPETYMVLVVESKESMLPTVVSRCHEVRFSALGKREIEDYLEREGGLEASEAARLARLSGGIFGRALLWARDPELASYWSRGVEIASSLRKVSLAELLREAEEAREMLKGAAPSNLGDEELKDYLKAMDKRGAERLKKRWENKKKRELGKIRRQAALDLFDGMSSFYRDIMLLSLMQEEGREPGEEVFLNREWKKEIEREALHAGSRESMRRLEALRRARKAVEANVDLALVMDSLFLELRSIKI